VGQCSALGCAELATEEAAVMTAEHGGLLSEQLSDRDRSAPREVTGRLFADGDDDPRGRGCHGFDVGLIAADCP
jgi:hypothetical protein